MNPSYMVPGERPSEATTGPDGRFELPLELFGENELTIDARGFFPHAIKYRSRQMSEDLGELALSRALMVRGRVLDESGRAIEAAKILLVDPCADDLRPSRWDVTDRALAITDATGAFEVPASSLSLPGLEYTLTALHDEYCPAFHHGTIEPGSRELRPALITMSTGATIRGTVSGLPDGTANREWPLAVALVARAKLDIVMDDDWMDDQSSRRIPIEADGTFSISGLRSGETVALSVWTGGAEKAQGVWRRSEWRLAEALADPVRATEVELEYLRPVRVRARAVNASGQPIERLSADTDVIGQLLSGAELKPQVEMADFPGGLVEWVFHADLAQDAPAFQLDVESDAAGHEGVILLEWEGTIPPLAAGAVHDFGDVTLQAPVDTKPVADSRKRSIEVIALDRHGHPMRGAWLQLKEAVNSDDPTQYARSNAEGRAEFRVPAELDHWVRIAIRDKREFMDSSVRRLDALLNLSPWVRVPASEGTETVTLKAPETAGATFSVTYGGEPLPGACLVLRWIPPAWAGQYRRPMSTATPAGERTDGTGRWSHDAMLPGNWLAHVFHPQLRMPESFEFTLAPGDQDVHFDRAPTSLEGRVLDADGLPIEGALVRAIGRHTPPVRAIHERDSRRMSPRVGSHKEALALRDIRYTRTDTTGYYRLEGVEPGVPLSAAVMATGFVIGTAGPATVAAGEAIDLGEIRLERGGRVDVRIPIGTEGNLFFEPIREEPGDDDPELPDEDRWSSIFDAESVDGLRPGRWTLTVTYHPTGSYEQETEHVVTLEVREDEAALVDLRR